MPAFLFLRIARLTAREYQPGKTAMIGEDFR
jgi:hypothetical protein